MEITLSLLLWRIGGIVRNRRLPCITVAVFRFVVALPLSVM